ncbi:MAG: DUF115 domain-containing protein [Spirochaetales bacterium]|nr:DUF115 domain-containing protein [Spirochaetales bacterium]MDY5914650.1 6-hydroxymethylpterin diphosphokinase MptE-like protein [Treponema sp.]
MNSIWNKNFSLFSKRFPQFAEILQKDYNYLIQKYCAEDLVVPFWQIDLAKNGQLFAMENKTRLHSSYNPQKEAFNAVNTVEVAQKGTTVFYGFGLGYHLVEWSKIYKDKKLIVIEPEIEHFLAALALTDLSEVFNVENLVFAVSCQCDQVILLLENGQKFNIGNSGILDCFFFDIPAFTNHAKEYFEQLKQLVKRNIQKNKINTATFKKFGKRWCKNSIKNIVQYSKHEGIGIFCDKASDDLPFLIVGAGPSVNEILPFLSVIKKKCIIICVETVLWAFVKAKVEPDFVILTDPQFWAYKHIANLQAKNSFLITEISVYPPVFGFECKNIFLCNSQFPIGNYFERKLDIFDKLGDLGAGGSVASCAWNFAKFCGAKEIYTAGLDFSFTEKQTHIKGSFSEQTFHTVSNKVNSAEYQTTKILFSADTSCENSFDGTKVLTDSRMKMFAWWFESRIANFPEIKNFSLCKKSLRIPGFSYIPLEDFLTKSDIEEKRMKFLSLAEKKQDKKNCLDINKIEEINKNFPNQEFLQEFPFLKDFL